MDHVHRELSQRFAKSCATAVFGYARAASAAYAALADQTLDFWSNAAKAGARAAEETDQTPRLQLVTGPRPYRSAVSAPAATVAAPMPLDFMRMTNAWASSPMFAPVRAWWGMFPLEGNPAGWPMAYAMMTAGVPRTVAMPAAEANVAAMDAAEAAKASFDHTFAAYRSESGFAVSQVISQKTWLGAMFVAPFTVTFKLPWA